MEEGLMDFGSFVPANAQSSELVQPGERAFDRPARFAEPAARVSAMGNPRMNCECFHLCAKFLRVVGFVGDERIGTCPWSTSFSFHRRNLVDRGQCRADVVRVGGR